MSIGPARARTFLFALLQILLVAVPSSLFAQDSSLASATSNAPVPFQIIVVHTQEKAQEILDHLRAGEDFAQLARAHSTDPTSVNGGYLGKFPLDSLRAELRTAAAGLAPGQISAITHLPSGYAILKIINEGNAGMLGVDPDRDFALLARGTVKYVYDVSGFAEAETSIRRYPAPAHWNADPKKTCEVRKQSLTSSISRLKQDLAPEHKEALLALHPPIDVMQMHFGLAQLYAYQGNMDLATSEYEVAYHMAVESIPSAVAQMEEALGISLLHKSEMENNVYHTPGKKCLFPMRPSDAYAKPVDSFKAIEYFEKYLAEKPGELEVLWLLNIAYMTVGKYPDGVPKKFLIPPSTFAAQPDVGQFVDVAFESGLQQFSTAGGVIVDDFENNGLFDIVTSGFESCGPMHYFHNNGDGTFTERTREAGLAGMVGGLNILQTDYNNDGCIDILVMRGAWEFPQRKSLLRNNCDGTFTDVTVQAGLTEITSSQAAVWVDINNDGLLDLFVGNENGPAQLFLNKGNSTFEDISFSSGVSGDGSAFSKGVAAADFDGDGYPDLYVSNLNNEGFLYHNNHDNTFTEVAMDAGVPGTRRGFATWFFDYDNDGLPDLFTTSYYVSVDETVRTYLGLPHNAVTLKLYKNLGNGKFRDVTAETHLDKVFMPMGANFGDIDNDGYLDIYLGTGNPSYASIIPNVLLHNHEGQYFEDVTFSSGTGELHKGHGVAFADLAHTGNEDIVAAVGGATPGDSHALRVFRNPGHGNDWISLKLVGVKTNRVAIGAQIKVTVQNGGGVARSIYRTVGSGGSFGSSPLEQHIGLGKSARIQSVDIFWPVSKTHQVFNNVAVNQFLEIKEFAETYAKLDRKPFRLGSQPSVATVSAAPAAAASGAKN